MRGGGVGCIQCTEQGLLQRSCRWCGGRPRGATAVLGSRREMGQSLSVGSPVVRGICRGALSLRYRSSATFPFAASSFSSLRFCLWKKPSWEEEEGGGHREEEKDRWELDNSYNIKHRRSSVREHVKIQLNPTSASNLNVTVFYCFSLKKSCLSTIF